MARRPGKNGASSGAGHSTAALAERPVTHLPEAEPAPPVTDRELVLAFQAGDQDAYDEIYRRCRPVVESISRRLLKNPDDAQEASQETMLRVLQALPRFNGRYLLQAWAARIATNVCLDALRARTRSPENGDQPSEEQLAAAHVNGNGNGNGHEP